VDFLNARPLLPWPGKLSTFKRVALAEKYGTAGGAQDGIDIRAEMEDGTVLAVQCKDWKRFDSAKGAAAMEKAEKGYTDAQAYLLVLTQPEIPPTLQKEAKLRGKWRIVGRDALSSWFLSGKLLSTDEQKRLVRTHFGEPWLRALFPISSDELLVSPSKFFQQKNLIRHDAALHGQATVDLAESLAETMAGRAAPRVVILTATGGQGKSRLLKAVAEELEAQHPDRDVFFQNDSADREAESFGLRGDVFNNASVFIDDAHRLENLRQRLLKRIAESPGATLLIAARPNSTEALKGKLRNAGFRDEDWVERAVPKLAFADRKTIASELLADGNDELAAWLADQSADCLLVCTAGAELFHSGAVGLDLVGSPDFRRKVFDHLMDSSLAELFPGDPSTVKTAVLLLKLISLAGPVPSGDENSRKLAQVAGCKPAAIDELIPQLECAGLLRLTRKTIRVTPDLLSDHLAYDVAYGKGKQPTLVHDLIQTFGETAFASVFGNLAEAEWRAKLEGTAESYLDGLWEKVEAGFRDPANDWQLELLKRWREFAVYQPEKTLKLAEMVIQSERQRIGEGTAELRYNGIRIDGLAILLDELPELLAPVANHHPAFREEALDLLWELGLLTRGPDESTTCPVGWEKIVKTASFKWLRTAGPEGVFAWLKLWVLRDEGVEHLACGGELLALIAGQWFRGDFERVWSEGDKIVIQQGSVQGPETSKFQLRVIQWLASEVVPLGDVAAHSALGLIRSGRITEWENETDRELFTASLSMIRDVAARWPGAVIRVSLWRKLSSIARRADCEGAIDAKRLRSDFAPGLEARLCQLASSYAHQEWGYEALKTYPEQSEYTLAEQWWEDLMATSIREMRARDGTVGSTLGRLEALAGELRRFRWNCSFNGIAWKWAEEFPNERTDVIESLFVNANHELANSATAFLPTLRADDPESISCWIAALKHPSATIRGSTIGQLGRKGVARIGEIARCLGELAASNDGAIVEDVLWLLSWRGTEMSIYEKAVESSLRVEALNDRAVGRLGDYLTRSAGNGGRDHDSELLRRFFAQLSECQSIRSLLPDHTLHSFHRNYPKSMFGVYMARIRAGRELPFLLHGWSLGPLGDESDYERIGRELIDLTGGEDRINQFDLRTLFSQAIIQHDAVLAGRLLTERIGRMDDEALIELAGDGTCSVVDESEEFLRAILKRISMHKPAERRRLERALISCSVPKSWSSSNGEVDGEYLWAKSNAEALAAHYRGDPQLGHFFGEIVKDQNARFSNTTKWDFDEE
jgi:hypothetical protein